MEINTKRAQLTNSIEVSVKGAGMVYSADFGTEKERLRILIDLLDAACEVLYHDIGEDEVLDGFHDRLIELHDELTDYITTEKNI